MTSFRELVDDLQPSECSDAEWFGADRHPPMRVIAPRDGAPSEVLVVSKLDVFDRVFGEQSFSAQQLIVARHGVWSSGNAFTLRALSGSAPVRFVGDLDPLDLTAWWTVQEACGRPVTLAGIHDAWLEAARAARFDFAFGLIELSEFERRHWSLLKKHRPDIPASVGVESTRILDAGSKLELEAIVLHAPPGLHPFLRAALRGIAQE